MTTDVTCYDCRFFSPGENGCPSYEHDAELGEFDEAKEGICRRHTPRPSDRIKRADADERVCFAEWPQVMTHDWCGQFQRRTASHCDGNSKGHICKSCPKGTGNCANRHENRPNGAE